MLACAQRGAPPLPEDHRVSAPWSGRRVRAFWVWLCLCAWPLAGWSMDHITERAWLEDPSGRLTLPAVQQQPLQRFDGVLALGYGAAPVWVRLRVDPHRAGPAPADLYLRIRPAYLDELTLYDPLQGSAPLGPLGDRQPGAAQTEPTPMFVFRLPAGTAPRDLWVRVDTRSTRMAHFEVLTEEELRRSNAVIEHLGALYLGLMVTLILWGVVNAAMRPDALIMSFVAYKLLALTFGAGMLGYLRLYAPDGFPPAVVDMATVLATVLSTAAVVVFSHYLLQELAPLRWHNAVMLAVLAVFPVAVVLVLAGQVTAGLQLNMLMVLLAPPLLWVLAWLSPERSAQEQALWPGLPRWTILGYLTLTMVITLLAALPSLGWMRSSELQLYIVLFYSVSSGLLMVATLHYRSHLLLRRQGALTLEAQHQREVAQQERRQRLEREQLLNMLGHELKTPLATMRMLLARPDGRSPVSGRLEHAVLDMAQVIERTVQTGQLEEGAIRVRLQPTDPQALVRRAIDALPDADAARVQLAAVPPAASAATVQTDPYLLEVVVRNLLDNALKYSPPETVVQVETGLAGAQGHWSLTVSNLPGRAGWPEPGRVFEKYYRSPGASHRSGSGLGLYMVSGLTTRLGGTLHYRPDTTHVRFCLQLPATTEP